MERLTKNKAMSRIKSSNTSIEALMRKALWREGIRYRKNVKTLPGKPDIAITKYKIAVFCDGELWHGKNWETKKEAIKTNRGYWLPKIERNIARDNKVEKMLENMGWTVLRFWGEDIKKDVMGCVNAVKEAIFEIERGASFGMGFPHNGDDNGLFLLAAEDSPKYGNCC